MRSRSDLTWDEKMQSLKGTAPLHVEVYLRSLAPPMGARQFQEQLLDTLTAIEKRGIVETISITVWGEGICPSSHSANTQVGREMLSKIDEFRSWAEGTDGVINIPFEERQIDSSITNETYRRIVPPEYCLAVYTKDDLELVLPCAIEGQALRISDFLDKIDQTTSAERGVGTSA